MRIVILTMGTHGDIRPYVALGKGLSAIGHEVCIGAPENFGDFITGHGLSFGSIGEDFEELLKSPEFTKGMEGKLLWHLPKIIKMFKPYFLRSLKRAWQVAQNADLIIIHPKCLFGIDIAEKLGVPVIPANLQPLIPTREFPLLIPKNYGHLINRASYYLCYGYSLIYGGGINDFRSDTLKLPRRSRAYHPLLSRDKPLLSLNAWSTHVLPKPHDWPANAHVTGFWFLDDPVAKLTPEIERFLNHGEPPLYIGFGSMAWNNESATTKVIDALKLWGGRAIIATGWGGLGDIIADNVLSIDYAPHDLLLPRTVAVVHHGGAGSMAAGLRAGRPTLICPVTADQPFWGQRVTSLGAGPSPARLKKTSTQQLANLFDELTTSEKYQVNAGKIASQMAEEDGVSKATHLIAANGLL